MAAVRDVRELVPAVAPVAVEHLLADLVGEVVGDKAVTVAELAAAAGPAELPAAPAGRPTPALLVDAVADSANADGTSLPATRAAVVLLRDLQVRALLQSVHNGR